MSNWRSTVVIILIALAAIVLYPRRQIDPIAIQKGVTEITFMGPNNTEDWLDVFREFEQWSERRHAEDPGKPIYRIISGQNAARNKVSDPTRFLVAAAGGSPPDVIYFDRYAVAEWAVRGAFTPLDEYIARDLSNGQHDPPPPIRERFYAPSWNEAIYQNKLYAIPINGDTRALFYNKDLLVRAGLVDARGEAKPPVTWGELREYANKLTEWDIPKPKRPAGWSAKQEDDFVRELRNARWDPAKVSVPLTGARKTYAARLVSWSKKRQLKVIGFAPNYGDVFLYMYSWMNEGEFISPDGKRCTLNGPLVAEALEYMKSIYDDLGGYEAVLGFQAGFQGNELDPFIQGKVAMKIDGYWALGRMASFGRDVNFGISVPPITEKLYQKRIRAGERPWLTWCGGWGFAIPTNARRKEAAWEFIRFLASDRAVIVMNNTRRSLAEAQGRYYLPGQVPIKDLNDRLFAQYIYDNPEITPKFKDGCRVFNDLMPYARFRPVTPVGQRLWNEQNRATENALCESKTGLSVQASLDASTREVQRDLDRFYHPVKGVPITGWRGFFIIYPLLLILLAVGVFYWDTNLAFRRRLWRLFRRKSAADTGIIEGTRSVIQRQQWWSGWMMASPWILGFIIFGGGPMLFSLIISFTDYDILRPPMFTGLLNYRVMFTQDPLFPTALANTAFMMLGVPIGLTVSLAIALLLNLNIRGMAVWRSLFYLPAIVPMVAASVLWVWILNPQGGLLNTLLTSLHIPEPPRWLQDPLWSKPSIILMGLWGAGGGMIIWLAGLKAIPHVLYEAASIDGANEWVKLWHITLPQLSPYIFFNMVMGLIGTFQIFGQSFIMTQGGPADSTLFYVYHLFNNAFRYGHMGYAAAMAWVLFVIVLALTIVQLKLSNRWVYYEAE